MLVKIKWQHIAFYIKIHSSVANHYIALQYQSDIGNQIKYQYGYYEMVFQVMQQLRHYFDGICLLEAFTDENVDEFQSYPLEIEMDNIGVVEILLFSSSAASLSNLLCQYFAKKSPLLLNSDSAAMVNSPASQLQPIWDDSDELSYSFITAVTELSPQQLQKLEVGDAVIVQELEPFIQLGSHLYVILDVPLDRITTVKEIIHHEG